MKKLLLLTTLISLLGLGAARTQAANTNYVILQLSGTIVSQSTNVTQTTNAAGTVTAIIRTITNTFNNADILHMLAVDHATSFPAGSLLALKVTGTNSGFKVLDSHFNELLDVDSNLSISNDVVKGSSTIQAVIEKISENSATTNATLNLVQMQSDSGIFYQDTQGNAFHIIGPEIVTFNEVEKPTAITFPVVLVNISGSGGGVLFSLKRNAQIEGIILKGSFIGAGRSLRQ